MSTMTSRGTDFPAHRPVVMGTRGVVAAAHPLAALAGVQMLQQGGNAIDAAVATAAALNVVEPFMSGLGGFGFLLFYEAATGRVRALNFSGYAPAAARPGMHTPETQATGPLAPLVPGNPAGWLTALESYGTLSRADVFAPAIGYAEEGFPLTHFGHRMFALNAPKLNLFPESARVYLRDGAAPPPGAVLRQPDLAKTFRQIVEGGAEAFYRGPLAAAIVAFCERHGGLITAEDLADYAPEWQEPLRSTYRGCEVVTMPPNSSGFQILETLNLLEGFEVKELGHNTAPYIHLLAEAMKLAVADRIAYGTDPKFTPLPLEGLLSKEYAAERRKRINLHRAAPVEGERWNKTPPPGAVAPGQPELCTPGMTTHFAVIDAAGNVVSVTQTLGSGFGCGCVVDGTGLALNNGIRWFETDPDCPTPNLIAPRKRLEMPMAPTQVYRDGRFWFSVSTPGSYGILQTTTQMLLNILEFGATLQQAIEAPRFKTLVGTQLGIEERLPVEVCEGLQARGHELVLLEPWSIDVGGAQGVMQDPASGARMGGGDPRRDGYAIAF
jgi:gamma-glutamyltranspeptidase/glutathione hydrolase